MGGPLLHLRGATSSFLSTPAMVWASVAMCHLSLQAWRSALLPHTTVMFGDMVLRSLSYAARMYSQGCLCPGCHGEVTGGKPAADAEGDSRECLIPRDLSGVPSLTELGGVPPGHSG